MFPAECAFVAEYGAQVLRDRWKSSAVPFWNPHRAGG